MPYIQVAVILQCTNNTDARKANSIVLLRHSTVHTSTSQHPTLRAVYDDHCTRRLPVDWTAVTAHLQIETL